ncbi:MAG: twin-arginine translocase TatA/TatE family subunit [Stellaceae bacterium]
MGELSIWHWLIVLAIVAVLFGGRGKLSGVMGDFAKGIKAFKSGMKEDEGAVGGQPPQVRAQNTVPSAANVAGEHMQKSG